MAQLVKWSEIDLRGYQPLATDDPEDFLVSIEASCVSGLEVAGQLEVKEVFDVDATTHQGRVFFDIAVSKVEEVLKLKCVDNVWVLFGVWPKLDLDLKNTPQEECLEQINNVLLTNLNWMKGLKAWNKVFKFFENEEDLLNVVKVGKTSKQTIEAEQPVLSVEDRLVPSFRCTCYRSGEETHSFGSMDIAKSFGGALHDHFNWTPKMKGHDLEIVVHIDKDQMYSCIALTRESLFKRNIVSFGPTTLRATICASMLKLAQIQPGDIVMDPMCGGGSIPIEAALGYPKAFHLGGDFHDKAVQRCLENQINQYKTGPKSFSADFFQWDVLALPLRDKTVDVFVTDLPFGKRSGSKADNRVLYPKILLSMARVVKPTTGRAVLLTQDKTSMFKCTGKFNKFWKTTRLLKCNIGGLAALVFLMQRTEEIP